MRTENKTCEQLVDSQMQDRNIYLEGLDDIINDSESDSEKIEEALTELRDFPAHIETYKVMKITLSGGGPADWIEVKLDEDDDVMGMTYHYADWFDHAERKIYSDSYLWDFAMRIVDSY